MPTAACGGDQKALARMIAIGYFIVIVNTIADLLRAYPTLRAEDLTNARAYVRAHREEIERQIRENEEAYKFTTRNDAIMSTLIITKPKIPLPQNIVNTLLKRIQPQRIFLFGSRARGDAQERADYDVPSTTKR